MKVLVCGGGNGAHVLAGIGASRPDIDIRVFTLFQDEARRWRSNMPESGLTLEFHSPDKPTETKVGKPSIVTDKASECVNGVDLIILAVPAFAHDPYFHALAPHLSPGCTIVGLPGQAGFELAARHVLGEAAKGCTLLSFESLPWACRIQEFGRSVQVLGTKGNLIGGIQYGSPVPERDPVQMLQELIGPLPVLVSRGHILGITIISSDVHPCIMYGQWHDYKGQTYEEAPLFYQGISQLSADLLSSVSDEAIAIAKAIVAHKPHIDMSNVGHIFQWYLRCYDEDISDKSNLYTAIRTNKSYEGLKHPMKKNEDGRLVPDFESRYMTEDIPHGFVVIRGIAEVAGVPTPTFDKIILWAQNILGKEYLVDGKLQGNDIGETRSPQRYGLTSMDQLLGL